MLRKKLLKFLILIYSVMFVVLIMSGCSSGTGEEFEFIVDFVPDVVEPDDNSVFLVRFDSDPDVLGLAVTAANITAGPIHSIYFDLVFRDYVLRYDSFEPATLLEQAGDVSYQVGIDSQDPSRLIVGITLLGDTTIEAGSEGAVIYLYFKPERLGTCPIVLENGWFVNSGDPDGQKLTGLAWYGGHAYVVK